MRGELFSIGPIFKRNHTYSNRKYKIPDHQNGQVYLTSHRICYVDNDDPRRNSTAIDLKDVDRYEFYVRTDYAILGGGSEGVHN